jgi:hypothetical protein
MLNVLSLCRLLPQTYEVPEAVRRVCPHPRGRWQRNASEICETYFAAHSAREEPEGNVVKHHSLPAVSHAVTLTEGVDEVPGLSEHAESPGLADVERSTSTLPDSFAEEHSLRDIRRM